MSELEDILSKIGMTENELRVYEVVVAFGFHTAGQIASKTNIPYSEVTPILDQLVKKNFLKFKEVLSKEGRIYYPMAPKIAISSDLSQSLSSRLKSLSSRISDIWGDAEQKIDTDTANLVQEIQNLLAEYANKVDILSNTNIGSIDSWADNSKHATGEVIEESIERLRSQLSVPLVEISEKMKSLSKEISKNSREGIENITSKTNEHQQSIESAVNTIRDELGEFADEVGFILSGRVSGLNQIIENLSSASTDKSESIITDLRAQYDEYSSADASDLNSINKNFVEGTMGSFDETKSKLLSTHQSYRDRFQTAIDSVESSYDEIRGQTVTSAKNVLQKMNSDQITTVTNLQEQFGQAVSTVQEKAVSQLGDILKSTRHRLDELNTSIQSNLDSYQSDLTINLNDLTSLVEEDLNLKFVSMAQVLTEFVDNLKNTTKGNVSETNAALMRLKQFLSQFLVEVESDFNAQLDDLSAKVSSKLGDVVQNTNTQSGELLGEIESKLSDIKSSLQSDISKFQNGVEKFLNETKSDLQDRLKESQETFKAGVATGVESYQQESSKITELQGEQIKAIAEEAVSLSKESEKARNDALQAVDIKLNEIKSNSIDTLNQRITSDVDKVSRELQRYNEKLERELRRFSEDFHENTSKLREDVPASIENMFLGQTNQLEGIRRQFDSNRRFISEFFQTVDQDLKPGEKNWKKKEFQNEFYERTQRIRSDFDRFQSEFQRYLDFALDDTEDVKNELLSTFNRTIQDEVVNLDELVTSQSTGATRITKEFLTSMDRNKNQVNDDMSSSITDTVSELISEVRKTLLTKFEQPLESIISKAQAAATGSEGVEQENRIIRAQNILISKINEAVDNLVDTLQSVFDSSISDLDVKVGESITESTKMVGSLRSNVDKAFNSHKTTVSEFTTSIQSGLEGARKEIDSDFEASMVESKENISTTFRRRGNEMENTVTEKTQDLDSSTEMNLEEVDNSLGEFKSNLDEIKQDTFTQVRNTINHSIATQKNALENTIGDLNEASDQVSTALNSTGSSLDENVGTILSSVATEVSQMVEVYQNSMSEIEQKMVQDIGSHFTADASLQTLEDLKSKLHGSVIDFQKNMDNLGASLKKEMQVKLSELSGKHNEKIGAFNDKFSSIVDQLGETNSNFILDLFDQVSTQLSSVQAEVLGSVENAKGNIDNTVVNSIETVRSDIMAPANEVIHAVGETSSEYAKKIADLANFFDSFANTEEAVIVESKSELVEKLSSSIDRERELWQDRGKKLYGDQSSNLSQLASDFEASVNTATSTGKEAVSGEITKIPDVIDETLDAAAKSMALLNEISKGAIELDPQSPDTSYFDVGAEAIKANLNALLSRTKSSVTIVTPNISWLDPELIPGFTRASVRIIIDENQLGPQDQELIEKFKQHNVSVSLRRLDRNRYRDDLNMIMAARDKEEVILSKLLTTDQPYAFVSQDEYFIEKFAELTSIFLTMPEYKS